MKNKKGFTLIELIAVVVILGLIVLIAVPFFQGGLKTFRDDYYSSLEKSVINSAKDFFSDNRLYLPTRYLETAKVDLNTLNQEKYLKNVTDYEGNSCNLTESYAIAVKVSREKYEYAVCMKCEDDEYENVESVYCSKAWDNKYGHTEVIFDVPPKVYIYKGTSRDKLKEDIKVYPDVRRCLGAGNVCEEEIKRVSAEGEEGVRAIYPLNIDNVDSNTVGVYQVKYQYDEFSEEKTGEVEVYEHSPATISAKKYNYKYDTNDDSNTVSKKKTKEVESVYDQNDPDDWAQKLNIKLNYNGSVGGKKVKVARYQWYVNGRWEDYCVPVRADDKDDNNSCNKTIGNVSGSEVEFNDTIKFRFIDTAGRISEENSYKIRIDFTPPEACTLTLTGDIRNGWYYSPSVRIDFSHKDDNNTRRSPNGTKVKSEINYYGITTGKRLKNEYNTQTPDTKKVTWYGYTEDKANNITVCSISFKKDSTAPSCTERGDNKTWRNSSVTVYWGCSDATSECATAEASQTFNGNDTFTKTWTKDAYDIYDNAGNQTTCPAKARDIYYDKKNPTCTDRGDNTTWKNTAVTVYWGCADQAGASGCYTQEDSKTFNTKDTFTKIWTKSAYEIKDNAGNTVTCPAKSRDIYYDKKNPTCTSSGGSSTWRNTNLTIYGTCADQEGASGCKENISKEYSSNINSSTESPGTVFDNAGNSVVCPGNQTVKIDKTAPTCASSGGSATWRNTDLTLTGTCTDTGGSGCPNITKTYSSNTNSTTESPGTVTDGAGNTATCPGDQTVKIDKTAPTCTSSGGSATWRNTDLTIYGTCADTGESGCKDNISKKYSSNINSATESPGTVYDNAGNSVTCPGNQTIKIDKTAPTCTSSGGSATWRNTNLTITGTCADTGGSGCAGNVTNTYSSNTNTTTASPGTVYDVAGNSVACPGNQTVKIDKTAPSCSFGSGSTVDIGSSANLVLTCTDSDSGIYTSSLSASNFTLNNTRFSIESVTTGTATNGKTFTLSMKAADNNTTTVTQNASTVRDVAGNYFTGTPSATMTGRRTYTLSYNCNGGTGSVSSSSCTITTNTSCDVTLSANASPGCSKTSYHFVSWQKNSTAYSAGNSYSLSSNDTVYVAWKANCPDGYTEQSNGKCKKTYDATCVCPSGYSLSGTTCSTTTTVSKNCADWVSNGNCYKTETVNKSCADWVSNGSCYKTETKSKTCSYTGGCAWRDDGCNGYFSTRNINSDVTLSRKDVYDNKTCDASNGYTGTIKCGNSYPSGSYYKWLDCGSGKHAKAYSNGKGYNCERPYDRYSYKGAVCACSGTYSCSCPSGYTENSSTGKCDKTVAGTWYCPTGYTANSSTGKCDKTVAGTWYCPTGTTANSSGTCNKTVTQTCTNTCNGSDTLSGTTCTSIVDPQ